MCAFTLYTGGRKYLHVLQASYVNSTSKVISAHTKHLHR